MVKFYELHHKLSNIKMKRHLSELTADSNDAKSSIMSEVDKVCGVTDNNNVPITDTNTEYGNHELDITFVKNKYKDYYSEHLKEEAPDDIK